MARRPLEAIDSVIGALEKRKVFTTEEAEREGISKQTLAKLVAKGLFARRARGVYYSPKNVSLGLDTDFVIGSKLFPKPAYVGGLTALDHYNLTKSPPSRIWMMVPKETQTRQSLFRLIRTKDDLKHGVLDKGDYRIASIERSLIDSLRYAYIWGVPTALYAIRTAMLNGSATYGELSKLARKLGYAKLFDKYSEIISPEAFGLQ